MGRLFGRLEQPLLVSSLINVRYLTGFTGSNAYLYARPDGATFLTDGRYAEVAELLVSSLPETRLEVYTGGLYRRIADLLDGAPSVHLEAAHITWEAKRSIASKFEGDLEPSSNIVERMRLVKDPNEVESLRGAAAAGDSAFARVGELAASVETEEQLGELLVDAMADEGGARAGWPPIVASGAHASQPHHESGGSRLEPGLLLLDYGCVVGGYHSDMTRTIWHQDDGDEEQERVYRAVLEANEAGISAVAPGVQAAHVDSACREVLQGYGYEHYFVHSTGHGVGLEIHEAPSLRYDSKDVLEVGQVITVEPGVYVPGRFGVRIEDMILVTENGGEVLTNASKEMRRA
jgi:Xaa-Pro aminopeptidase